MQRHAKRLILIVVSIVCLVVGAITLPTPLPIGIVLIAVGLALLILSSKTFRNMIRRLRVRYPSFDDKLRKAEAYLPRPLQRALKISAPRARPNDNSVEEKN